MIRIISLVFGVSIFAVWLYFQGISLNLMAWSLDTQAYHEDLLSDLDTRDNRTPATQPQRQKRLSLNEQILNISGELAFDPTHFVRNRIVSTERHFKMADILDPGEAVPEPDYQRLYAMARAPMIMLQDCTALLEIMARSCRVAKTSVKREADGSYILSASLQYLPAYEMGLPKDKAGEIVRFTADWTPDLPVPDSAEQRTQHVERAVKLCAALKAKYGNCFINRISFALRRAALTTEDYKIKKKDRVPKPLLLHSFASFSVHGVWSDVNEQSLAVAVAEWTEKQ